MKWAVLKDFGQPLDMHYNFPSMISTKRVQDEDWCLFGLECKCFVVSQSCRFSIMGEKIGAPIYKL